MPDIVQQALAMVNDTSEADRQASQEKRLSMYLDAYDNEIDLLLRSQFHKDNVARLYPMLAKYYNVLKKITNLKSVLYKREAERKWYKKDGLTIDDKYSDVLRPTNIHSAMQLCNKITNVNNTSFVRVIPDMKTSNIRYSVVPSELINITQNPDDPSEITSLLHRLCVHDSYDRLNGFTCDDLSTKYNSKYLFWTKDQHIILDGNKDMIYNENNKDNINPYGVIPYQLFTNFPSISGSIWNETVNDDLYSGTLQVNVLQTYLNNAIKLLGYMQIFISGMDSEEAKKLDARVSDALQPITASDPNAKMIAVEMSNGVTEIRESIHDIMSEIADNHGISYNQRTESASKSSGKALEIEKEQVDNIRDEQTPLYRESEKLLAYKTIKVANVEFNSGIDEEGNLSINFYEDQEELEEKDQIVRDQFNLKNNIISVIDLYKQHDTDVPNDKEVIKRMEYNKKINDSLLPTFNLDMDDEESDDTE